MQPTLPEGSHGVWACPSLPKFDLSTGNLTHASHLLCSGDLCFLFTAPYSPPIAAMEKVNPTATAAIPTFDRDAYLAFSAAHGLGVRAIAIEVENAETAFHTSVAHGAKPSAPPVFLDNRVVLSEVRLYGDVVLRYISYNDQSQKSNSNPDSWFLPRFEPMEELSLYPLDYGIRRFDHAVWNVPNLAPAVTEMKKIQCW